MEAKLKSESVESDECNEPIHLSMQALPLVKTEIKPEVVETEARPQTFVDLTSDDEELPSFPIVLVATQTGIMYSFVDLTSEDDKIPQQRPDLPLMKTEIKSDPFDGKTNAATNKAVDQEMPVGNLERDEHHSTTDEEMALRARLLAGSPLIDTDDETESEFSADEADALNVSFYGDELPKNAAASSNAPPLSETELSPESLPLVEMELKSEKSPLAVAEVNSKPSPVAKTELHSKSSHSADAEMNSIDKCDGNIHNRGQHVNLFPRGRCEATPLDRADRKRARFAEKNDECERPSTKLAPPKPKTLNASEAITEEFCDYEILQRPRNNQLTHSRSLPTNDGPVFVWPTNDAQVFQSPNNNGLASTMAKPYQQLKGDEVHVTGYEPTNRKHPNPDPSQHHYNININVYNQPHHRSLPQFRHPQPQNNASAKRYRRRARKRAFKEQERLTGQQPNQTDRPLPRQQSQNKNSVNVQSRMQQYPTLRNELSVSRVHDKGVTSNQTLNVYGRCPVKKQPTPNILPWQLNPLEPAPLDFGWTKWNGYQPS